MGTILPWRVGENTDSLGIILARYRSTWIENISVLYSGCVQESSSRAEGLKHQGQSGCSTCQLGRSKAVLCASFQRYMSVYPNDAPITDAFHLRPAIHPTASSWYSKQPLSHTKLWNSCSSVFRWAGIQGHKTSHSLRATTTSRLSHWGIDEQFAGVHLEIDPRRGKMSIFEKEGERSPVYMCRTLGGVGECSPRKF